MDYLRDEDIATILVSNPILDAKAELRLAKAKELFTPTMPLSVIGRAQAVSSNGTIVLLLIGLAVKLARNRTVRLSSNLVSMSGLSEYQLKRTLKALVSTGFVQIASSPGKRREITLLDKEYLGWLERQRYNS